MTMFTDLTLLRGFVSIVDSGSISAAARNLHLTQSTLSRRLQSLEDQCGSVLLRRDTHRMRLTDTGHRLLADARALLALAEESEQRLRNEQTAVEGNIRIFATIDFGQSVVSRMIASFIQAHPAITTELGYSNRPLHMIEEGCDAGVIWSPGAWCVYYPSGRPESCRFTSSIPRSAGCRCVSARSSTLPSTTSARC